MARDLVWYVKVLVWSFSTFNPPCPNFGHSFLSCDGQQLFAYGAYSKLEKSS